MLKILKYLKSYWLQIIFIVVFIAIQAWADLTLPLYMSNLIDFGINGEDVGYILKNGLIMILYTLLSVTSLIIGSIIIARVATGLAKGLRSLLFDKTLQFSNVEFDKFSSSSLITRTTNDVQQVQTFLSLALRMFIYAPLLAIGGIIKVMTTNANLTWIIFIAVISVIVIIFTLVLILVPKFKIIQELVDKINLVVKEALSGLLVVRAFSTETHEEKRFDEINIKLTKTNIFLNKVGSLLMPAMILIMSLTTVGIVWYGSFDIIKGDMLLGELLAFIQYATQIIMAFLLMSFTITMLPRASVSANRILDILNTNLTITDPENPEEKIVSENGEVVFENIYFKYPNADEYALENINFKLNKGETMAFVGGTGAGKSSIVKLLLRFYDPTSGNIYVDGINIKEMKQSELRKKLGYIPQKAVLFTGTIESNIKFGNPNILNEDMVKSIKISQSEEFINKKELKYEEPISQGGTNVSGGQRQRLSIARALAKNSEILIFDDSFSALDYKTDLNLRNSLAKEVKDASIIIIAQRINTIKEADKIIVLDEGKIIGSGTHEQLIESCNVYKEISLSQI